MPANRSARRRVLGLISLALLLPVPAYATINWSTVGWTLHPDPGGKALIQSINVGSNGGNDSLITFNIPLGGSPDFNGSTTGTTVVSDPIPVAANSTINGTWTNLNQLTIPFTSLNTASITITTTNSLSPNMFASGNYSSGPPPNTTINQSTNFTAATTVITVTFSSTGDVFFQRQSTTITLDFTN
jgi:hypothetical protein